MAYINLLIARVKSFLLGFFTCLFGTLMFVWGRNNGKEEGVNNNAAFYTEKDIEQIAEAESLKAQRAFTCDDAQRMLQGYTDVGRVISEAVRDFDSFADAKYREAVRILSQSYTTTE